ncbi:MAG: aminomethyltransferase beta-barrel domain-containing protein, partial [Patescibacteria group bacterium]
NQKLKIKNQNYKLYQAKDKNKDQSYFLWTLTQDQLKYCLFPIGDYAKSEVRALAKKYDLPTAEKPDSQGVCFVGEIDVAGFLKEKLGKNPGPIKTTDGKIIGNHDGAIFYTIGQRKGIGVKGSLPGEQGKIYYVASKDVDANTLWVAEGESQKLFSKELIVKDINWISGKQPKLPLKCLARIRYRQPLQNCSISKSQTLSHSNDRQNTVKIMFDVPQRAITPGQSAVFYLGGKMLGGGIIV